MLTDMRKHLVPVLKVVQVRFAIVRRTLMFYNPAGRSWRGLWVTMDRDDPTFFRVPAILSNLRPWFLRHNGFPFFSAYISIFLAAHERVQIPDTEVRLTCVCFW